MTPSLDFPAELYDLVIDHMHGQKHALGACGLVNKAWLISSRYHLFGSVTLRDSNWKDFVQLLASPLATFAQSLTTMKISLSNDDESPASSFNELISRLQPLPTLKGLRLENVYWTGVTDATTDLLVELLHDIKELDLHLVVFSTPRDMAALVSRFLRLRTAFIYPVFEGGGALQISDYPEIPRSLECLRLRASISTSGSFSEVAFWFYAGASLPALRVLELGILDAQSLPSVGDLLRALGSELHDLNLKLMYHVTRDDIRAHIDLSRNTNLHSLTVHVSVRRFQRPSSLHAPWALLATPHSPINTLTIVLSIDVVELIDNLDWNFLNTAIRTYPHFQALQHLNFIVHCHSTMDTMDKAIRACVPEFNSRGIVKVTLLHTARVFTMAT
ncbi:hypothetical protein MSAN_00661400 [Mycena sanguinolenta]|uniref:Uncharacterized protein n=1 Tax=Mycena sanguinolenta TaxID=230812 RepID=A0A8H7DG96_9AGAR|nr:hypothetical protein MSAN_00661400 [Mycena sanguinolenta]